MLVSGGARVVGVFGVCCGCDGSQAHWQQVLGFWFVVVCGLGWLWWVQFCVCLVMLWHCLMLQMRCKKPMWCTHGKVLPHGGCAICLFCCGCFRSDAKSTG